MALITKNSNLKRQIQQNVKLKKFLDQSLLSKNKSLSVSNENPNSKTIKQEPTNNAVTAIESPYPESMCRICLNDGDLPIYQGTKDISKEIKIITGIQIKVDDPYPKYLCHNCNETLKSAILFRQTAHKSRKFLENKSCGMKVEENICFNNKQGHNGKDIKKEEEDIDPCMTTSDTDEQFPYEVKQVFEVSLHIKSEAEDIDDPCAATPDTEEQSQTKDLKPIFKVSLHNEETKLFCGKCSLNFDNIDIYANHMLTDDHKNVNDSCPFCLRQFKCIVTHLELHKKFKIKVCHICGQIYMSNIYVHHRKTHTNVLPFKCDKCPHRSRTKTDLITHMRTHTGERPYTCTDCGSQFTSNSNLNRHLLTHKNEFKMSCEVCQKGFHFKRDLETHMTSHTGNKIHQCDICSKVFAYRRGLRKHARKMHNRKPERAGRTPIYLKNSD